MSVFLCGCELSLAYSCCFYLSWGTLHCCVIAKYQLADKSTPVITDVVCSAIVHAKLRWFIEHFLKLFLCRNFVGQGDNGLWCLLGKHGIAVDFVESSSMIDWYVVQFNILVAFVRKVGSYCCICLFVYFHCWGIVFLIACNMYSTLSLM